MSRIDRSGCQAEVCACHDNSAWTEGAYPNGCFSCGCQWAESPRPDLEARVERLEKLCAAYAHGFEHLALAGSFRAAAAAARQLLDDDTWNAAIEDSEIEDDKLLKLDLETRP